MLKAIIIDDEKKGREAVRIAVEKFCPTVELVAMCETPVSGIEAIEKLHPDLVFLDIQMPYMSGFDLLQHFQKPEFDVIFVTAHNHYAIKAIKFSALDYLLKPIEVAELVSAVKRAEEKRESTEHSNRYRSFLENMNSHKNGLGKLAIPTMEGIIFIKIADVVYCESEGNYTIIHLKNKEKMLVSKTLRDFEGMLENQDFFRIHNSFLINLRQVQRYVKGEGGYVEMSNGGIASVSRRKKDEFLKRLAEA